jgi:trimethylamine---corrinoid protein Co-methyltransferase
MIPALAGANMMYGMGMLDMGMVLSFSQMVMDDDMAAMVKRVVNGIDVEEALLAVDLIKKVGIGGNFLGQKHTMQFLADEQIQSKILDRRMRGAWEKRGSKTLDQVAIERAREILKSHEPTPLPEDVQKELAKIVKSAE